MLSRFSKLQIGGTLVSLAIALIAWLVTRDALSSLIVGLISETLALLVDLNQKLGSIRTDVLGVLELRNTLMDHREVLVSVLGLGGSLAEVLDSGNPLFLAQAKELMTEFSHQVNCLRQGYVEISPPSPLVRGVNILDALEVGGFATSIVGRGGFWRSEAGQAYHRANLRAARLGRRITRVFLLSSEEVLRDGEFRQVLDEQIESDIEVHIAWLKYLEPELRVDFGLWDDKLVVEPQIVPGTIEARSVLLDTRDATLARARRLRNQLLAKSVPIGSMADLERLQLAPPTTEFEDGA